MNNKKYVSYFKLRRIYRIGLGIFAVLFGLIAIVTYYGQHTGNFVIMVDDLAYSKGIVVSKDHEFKTQSSRVVANALDDVDATTLIEFDGRIPEMLQTDGDYKDPVGYSYLAFTFYVKNVGEESADVEMNLDILENINDVASACRVLLIEDDTNYYLYQKPDEPYFDYYAYDQQSGEGFIAEDSILRNPIYFVDDTKVCTNIIQQFRPNQVKKYTFILWLEGTDPDCGNKIAGGKIKMQMNFSIIDEDEEA